MGAVRPQRLAQHGLSRSRKVTLAHLAPLTGRGRNSQSEFRVRDSRRVRLSREPLTPTLSPQERDEGEVGSALLLPPKTRYAWRMAHPLARIVEQLKREPSRT